MASPDDFFNGTLEAFRRGKMPAYAVFDLGLSPQVNLRELPRANVFLHQAVMRKAMSKHGIPLDLIKNLPSLICDPLNIYRSRTEPNSVVFRLNLMCQGEQVVVATEYLKHADFGMSHIVKSLHHRDLSHFSLWENEGLLIYTKK